jgi:hypothetical protein
MFCVIFSSLWVDIIYLSMCFPFSKKNIFLCVEEGNSSNGPMRSPCPLLCSVSAKRADHSSNSLVDGIGPLLLRVTSTTLNFSPTLSTILHVDHLINP